MKKILITGVPQSGKSTLLESVLSGFPDRQGFVTREMQEKGDRAGFEVITASGQRMTLAHTGIQSPYKVSRYGVQVGDFEKLLPGLAAFSAGQFLYIDEIGQMELFAAGFADLVHRYMAAPNLFIGTVSKVFSDDTTRALLGDRNAKLIDIDALGRTAARQRLAELLAA